MNKKMGSNEYVKKLAEEEAIKATLSNEYDFIQARIEADRLLALRLQDEEREQFTMEERAKFLHDTIAAQRRFLAEQRAIAIRNKPPTRTQKERKIKEMNEGAKDLEQKRLKKKVVKETPKKEDTQSYYVIVQYWERKSVIANWIRLVDVTLEICIKLVELHTRNLKDGGQSSMMLVERRSSSF
ncbi:hypothetical protein Tco_1420632 [Tanacetum coccineum]